MPTMTIYTDNQPQSSLTENLFRTGHFYVRLEGAGLDQGVFSTYTHDTNGNSVPDVTLGFFPDGIKDNTARQLNNENAPGILQKPYPITLSDAEFSAVKSAAASWISNAPSYYVASNNCADFANAMYVASGKGTNFFFAHVPQADLNDLDSGAARYAGVKYLGDVPTVGMVSAFTVAMYVSAVEEYVGPAYDYVFGTSNPQLDKYAYKTGGAGQVPDGYILANSDTVYAPDTTGALQAYNLALGTEGGQAFSFGAERNIFLGGNHADLASYNSLTGGTGVSVDLASGYAKLVGGTEIKDYFNGAVLSATGSSYADSFKGDIHANIFSCGAGNDTVTCDGGDSVTSGSGTDRIAITHQNTGTITVTDFTPGTDVLDLSALGVFLADVQANATEGGGNTTLHLPGGQDVVIQGVSKTNLFNPANNAFTGLIGGTSGNALVGNSSANTIDTTSANINGHYDTANNDNWVALRKAI